jgi:hypothetical protein
MTPNGCILENGQVLPRDATHEETEPWRETSAWRLEAVYRTLFNTSRDLESLLAIPGFEALFSVHSEGELRLIEFGGILQCCSWVSLLNEAAKQHIQVLSNHSGVIKPSHQFSVADFDRINAEFDEISDLRFGVAEPRIWTPKVKLGSREVHRWIASVVKWSERLLTASEQPGNVQEIENNEREVNSGALVVTAVDTLLGEINAAPLDSEFDAAETAVDARYCRLLTEVRKCWRELIDAVREADWNEQSLSLDSGPVFRLHSAISDVLDRFPTDERPQLDSGVSTESPESHSDSLVWNSTGDSELNQAASDLLCRVTPEWMPVDHAALRPIDLTAIDFLAANGWFEIVESHEAVVSQERLPFVIAGYKPKWFDQVLAETLVEANLIDDPSEVTVENRHLVRVRLTNSGKEDLLLSDPQARNKMNDSSGSWALISIDSRVDRSVRQRIREAKTKLLLALLKEARIRVDETAFSAIPSDLDAMVRRFREVIDPPPFSFFRHLQAADSMLFCDPFTGSGRGLFFGAVPDRDFKTELGRCLDQWCRHPDLVELVIASEKRAADRFGVLPAGLEKADTSGATPASPKACSPSINSRWLASKDERPAEFRFGPLEGTKRELTAAMNKTDQRQIENASLDGAAILVRIARRTWQLWFSDGAQFDFRRQKLLEIRRTSDASNLE